MIEAAAATYGLDSQKIVTRQANRQEVPVLLSFSSYSIFFIKACYSKISSSPTKHGEIMAMGIPVITNSGVGDVEEIVNKYHGGYVLHDFSEKAINEVVNKIAAGNQFNSEEIRNGAKEYYSLSEAVNRYRYVYELIFRNAQ